MSDKKTIKFYRQNDKYGCFSNFSNHSVNIDNKRWPTTEHYFQAKKFEGSKWEERLRKCTSAGAVKKMGNRRDLPFRKDWEKVKDQIMYDCVKAKFEQHEKIKNILLSTGNAKIVEHTKNDRYWADGGDGRGKNMLGIILMRVRDDIKDNMNNGENLVNIVQK